MKDNKTPRTGNIDIKKALSFVTLLLFMILTYCVILKIYGVKPLYENIDDYFLKMISSGEISTVPEAHLRYISIVSGVLLKLLYTIFPGASWYGIWFLSLYMAAFSSILFMAGADMLPDIKHYGYAAHDLNKMPDDVKSGCDGILKNLLPVELNTHIGSKL